ncbi:MAG: DNA repair protein RecO [Pirellulaceae bacterium]
MSSEKSAAIVLRVTEFSETSCVVTLFTRDFGKITGLAKGARRRKSPFESALDVLSQIRVVFLHKNTEAMDLLTEAKLERRFRSAARNLDCLNCGYYVAELLNSLTNNADPMPDVFDLAQRTLVELDENPARPFVTLTRFEMELLHELGHSPMLNQCVACGDDVESMSRQYFSALMGGLICSTCRSGKTGVITLSAEAWELLDELACPAAKPEMSVAETAEPFGVETRNPAGLAEVRETLNLFVSHLLGKRPRLQAFLKLDGNRGN